LIGERPEYGQKARSKHSALNYTPHTATKDCVRGTKCLPVEGSNMTSQEEGQDTRNLNYVQEKL